MEHLSYTQSLELIAQIFKELDFSDDYSPSFSSLHQVLEYENYDRQKIKLIQWKIKYLKIMIHSPQSPLLGI